MMIKPILVSILAAASLVTSAFSAHIGDSVESIIPAASRVDIPNQGLIPTEITHITLDSGVWSISGQVIFLTLHQPNGILLAAANISVDTVSFGVDGTAGVQAEHLPAQGEVGRSVALTPRVVEVPDGTKVFLVGGELSPNTDVTAWGFISAVKIRNHVP